MIRTVQRLCDGWGYLDFMVKVSSLKPNHLPTQSHVKDYNDEPLFLVPIVVGRNQKLLITDRHTHLTSYIVSFHHTNPI